MKRRTLLLIFFIFLLSIVMSTAQQAPNTSRTLYKELQELQQKRLPAQSLDCAKRLITQALQENNLTYTIKGLAAHEMALVQLDYNRQLEQFAFLHKAWQERAKFQESEQRYLALYIAERYIYLSNNYYWQLGGLRSYKSEQDNITPLYWSDKDFLRTIYPLLEVAFAPSKKLYHVITQEEAKELPNELYVYNLHDKGAYTQLSHLLQMISLEQLQRLELRAGNTPSWCDRIRKLFDEELLEHTDQGAKLYAQYQAILLDSKMKGIAPQSVAERLEKILQQGKERQIEALRIYRHLAYYYVDENNPLRAYHLIMPYLEWLEQHYPQNRNFSKEMHQLLFSPQVNVIVPSFVLAQHQASIKYCTANVKKLSLRLYAISPLESVKRSKQLPKQAKLIWQQDTQEISGVESIVTKNDSIELPTLPIGHYRLQVITHHTAEAQRLPYIEETNVTTKYLTVSDQMVLSLKTGRVQLLNALTGDAMQKPVRILNKIYISSGTILEDLGVRHLDPLGIIFTPRAKNYEIYLLESADKNLLLPSTSEYDYSPNDLITTKLYPRHTTLLQTDRSLYQLGDEVQLYIVAYRITANPQEACILPNRQLTIKLLSPQEDVVNSLEVKTDEWGRVRASIPLPKEAMTGTYSIAVSGSNKQEQIETRNSSFEVAEYQRPNYLVTLEMPEVAMRLGDTITAQGSAKTYSGYPLSGATIRYSITGVYNNWWNGDNTEPQLLASGDLAIDENDGSFTLPITLFDLRTEAMRQSKTLWALHSYQIELTVTAPSGETQLLQRSIWIGRQPVNIMYDGTKTFFKELPTTEQPFTLSVTNEDSNAIKTTIQLKLTSQADTTRSWTKEIEANEKQYLPTEWLTLPSGVYRLTFIYQSEQGDTLEEKVNITLFAQHEKSLLQDKTLWCATPSDQYTRGGAPTIYYSSCEEQQAIYYIIKVADKPAIYGVLPRLPRHQVGRWQPTLPESIDPKGQLSIQLYTVRDGHYRHETLNYTYTPDQPTLSISWIEMPEKLLAGATHTWQARLTYSDGTPAQRIPIMAWMYDAALEALNPHYISSLSQYSPLTLQEPFPETTFIFGVSENSQPNRYGNSDDTILYDMVENIDAVSSNDFPKEEEITATAPKIRSDFSQTAFFLTNLYTDDDGLVTFTSKMPEGLSSYRLCLFGYDSRLVNCSTTEDIATYREIMVETLRPRFLMQGDEAYLTGSVRNLTEKALCGTLRVVLYDAAKTESSATPLSDSLLEMSLTVPSNGVIPYAIPLPALPAIEALRVQVYFVNESISDGEEYIIPVKPATVRTVESTPFSWDHRASYEYPLSDLLSTTSDQSGLLHLQLWSNPRYFALQQLPILFNNSEPDAINTILRIYTLTHTQQLLRQPEISQWIKSQASTTDGANKLTDNRKTLLLPLDEMPWRATEQWLDGAQEQLWTLFKAPQERTTAKDIAQLSNLQTASGEWSWYPNMPSSSYLTPLILDYLCAVYEIDPNEQIQSMISRGWQAYDLHTMQLMQEMKKELKKRKTKQLPSIPEWGTEWLYLSIRWRGAEVIQSGKTTKALADFLIPLLIKDAQKLPLYTLPQAAYTLNKLGKTEQAHQLAEILHDHLSYEPAQGAFFANTLIGGYFWRDRSMSLQRETIALFETLGLYPDTVQQMRRWSMEYLRTNLRASNLSQIELLLSLLEESTAQSTSEDQVTISIPLADGTTESIVTDSYCYLQYKPSELDTTRSIVVTHSESTALLWGGILSISSKPLSSVLERQGELTIETETFVREEINGQLQERPIQLGEKLSVGTILTTKLRITTRRDLDFITIRDMRPACCEPLEQLSRYQMFDRFGCYVEARNTAQLYHIDNLHRGSYEISYEQSVVRPGIYQRGITQAQCAYAPEYSAQTSAQSSYTVTSHD